MDQTTTQRDTAEKFQVTPEWFNKIINGKANAGYELSVKLCAEIGGDITLWKTNISGSKRKVVWRDYLTKLEAG